MTSYLDIHPVDPQPRLIRKAVEMLDEGGVIAYPTDSGYALGCKLGNHDGLERIRRLRQLDNKHNFTLVCHDFSQLGHMVIVDNSAFRLIKALTPGPFTFIMKGDKQVPRIMLNPKKHTVGARIPDHRCALALVGELGEPMMSVSLILPGREEPETEGWAVREQIGHSLEAVIEGEVGQGPTTVIDMTDPAGPQLLRQGTGDASAYL